ncbi:MAG TPA: sensor histidine kinase [Stellaceae bacterium]|nr:sensor histidine kinase [Stellaceae bacterium]
MAFAGTSDVLGTTRRPDLGSRLGAAAAAVLRKLAMHHVLFIAFTLIAAVPVFTLASWVENHAVRQEIDSATDKHLLVARNLTAAFSRYVFDLKAGFRMAISTFSSGEQGEGLKDLLTSLEFRHICIVNAATGEVERYMPGLADATSDHITLQPQQIAEFRKLLTGDDIVITDLRRDAAGNPAFFILKALPDDRIAYGVIGTQYLIALQKAIAFGARGHATILDRTGHVVAHPFQNWIDKELDLSKIPPVKAIMAGQTGVMQFYSPAFKADMITAYTSVPETGWGILVPQPMDELYARAREVRTAATTISFFGLLAAALLSWLLAKYIARPLQAVGKAAATIAGGDMSVRVPTLSPLVPHELHELSGSFNRMVDEVSRKNLELADTATRAEAASRSKSEFLANMSHELRTPLNAILGFSEVMRDEVFGPLANERYQAYAQDINSSASHLIKVITDILDLSKAEAGAITVDLGPVMIPEAIDMAVRLIDGRAREGEITVDTQVPPALAEEAILSDGSKVTQILLNLLSNAVKFTKPGGHVTVGAERCAGEVAIAIRDTGIGIAAEDLDKVMAPFGQVQSAYHAREGFGLGLPLSKKLAEQLGGSLTIESQLDRGTVVTLRLPFVAAAEPCPA